MYAIAFFATVILFSAALYIGHKFVEIATHFDDSDIHTDAHSDILINPSMHLGAFRRSA